MKIIKSSTDILQTQKALGGLCPSGAALHGQRVTVEACTTSQRCWKSRQGHGGLSRRRRRRNLSHGDSAGRVTCGDQLSAGGTWPASCWHQTPKQLPGGLMETHTHTPRWAGKNADDDSTAVRIREPRPAGAQRHCMARGGPRSPPRARQAGPDGRWCARREETCSGPRVGGLCGGMSASQECVFDVVSPVSTEIKRNR